MSDFTTIAELARIPRGEHGELRIELTECADDRGNASQFVNARLWFKGDRGDMLPGKQGLTIRKTEIHDFGKALRAALDIMNGTRPPAPPKPKPAPRKASDDDYYPFDEDLSAGGHL